MYQSDNWFHDRLRSATAKALNLYRRSLQEAPLLYARGSVMGAVQNCYFDFSGGRQRVARVISQSIDWSPAICDWFYFRWDSDRDLLGPVASFNRIQLAVAILKFHADLGTLDERRQRLFARQISSEFMRFEIPSDVPPIAIRPTLGVDRFEDALRRDTAYGTRQLADAATMLVNCVEIIRDRSRQKLAASTRGEASGAGQYSCNLAPSAALSTENLFSTVFPTLGTALDYWHQIDQAKLNPAGDYSADPDGTRFLLRQMLDNCATLIPLFGAPA